MNTLVRYFFRGLLVLVPVTLTIGIIWFVFTRVDRFIGAPIDRLVGLPIPGTGVLVFVLGTLFIGALASNFLTKRAFVLMDRLFERVPFVKILYSSIRDLTGAFVGERKAFDRPVLVTLGQDLGGFLGFATRDALAIVGLPDHVAVYFPQSYNFAGNVVIVPRRNVRELEADSAQVMAFIVSGGVSGLMEEGESARPRVPKGQ